jgi:hypothetical protein
LAYSFASTARIGHAYVTRVEQSKCAATQRTSTVTLTHCGELDMPSSAGSDKRSTTLGAVLNALHLLNDSYNYTCYLLHVQGPPAREVQKLLVLGGTPLVNDVWLLDDVTQGLDGEWVTEWILVRYLKHGFNTLYVNILDVCWDVVAGSFTSSSAAAGIALYHCTQSY